MRIPLIASSIFGTCLVTSGLTFAQARLPDEFWKLVAQSHLIVDGIPAVPVGEIEKGNDSGKHNYVNVAVRVARCLKGDDCPQTIAVRYFTRPDSDSPSARTLAESNGNQSVLFLTQVDTHTVTHAPEIYLAGHTPKAIQPYSEELFGQVTAEVLAQKEVIRQFARNFRSADEPSQAKVRSLIEAMLHRPTEKGAFAELEALGDVAVPAMIMFMDDRRELPLKEISLRNGPGGFEPFRHYGPQVVVDAIDAILNQITGESFGSIQNGASERQRKATIDGWRVYLHRKRFGTRNPSVDGTQFPKRSESE